MNEPTSIWSCLVRFFSRPRPSSKQSHLQLDYGSLWMVAKVTPVEGRLRRIFLEMAASSRSLFEFNDNVGLPESSLHEMVVSMSREPWFSSASNTILSGNSCRPLSQNTLEVPLGTENPVGDWQNDLFVTLTEITLLIHRTGTDSFNYKVHKVRARHRT